MKAQELMDKAKSLLSSKGEDYTKDPTVNQFENFDKVAIVASWFENDIDKPYAVLVATKLVRLATLLNGKSPKNESILDSFLDLINYAALWGAKRAKKTVAELEKILNEEEANF